MQQPLRRLLAGLDQLALNHAIFTPVDLRALVPELSQAAFKTLLSRAVQHNHLSRICRGIYGYRIDKHPTGLLLFHVAARLRASAFNYLSLETVLSDAGVISQLPMNRIFLMSSGRSSTISCGRWGSIEFIHTQQRAGDLVDQLHYDNRCRLWRCSVKQALRDMRATKRSLDLINWSVANEFI